LPGGWAVTRTGSLLVRWIVTGSRRLPVRRVVAWVGLLPCRWIVARTGRLLARRIVTGSRRLPVRRVVGRSRRWAVRNNRRGFVLIVLCRSRVGSRGSWSLLLRPLLLLIVRCAQSRRRSSKQKNCGCAGPTCQCRPAGIHESHKILHPLSRESFNGPCSQSGLFPKCDSPPKKEHTLHPETCPVHRSVQVATRPAFGRIRHHPAGPHLILASTLEKSGPAD
jgi:hypothetical protein